MAYCINFPVGGPKYVMFKPPQVHWSESPTYRTPVAEAPDELVLGSKRKTLKHDLVSGFNSILLCSGRFRGLLEEYASGQFESKPIRILNAKREPVEAPTGFHWIRPLEVRRALVLDGGELSQAIYRPPLSSILDFAAHRIISTNYRQAVRKADIAGLGIWRDALELPFPTQDVFVSEALGLAMQALPVIGIDEYAPLIEV
jgi:hypothetical protein